MYVCVCRSSTPVVKMVEKLINLRVPTKRQPPLGGMVMRVLRLKVRADKGHMTRSVRINGWRNREVGKVGHPRICRVGGVTRATGIRRWWLKASRPGPVMSNGIVLVIVECDVLSSRHELPDERCAVSTGYRRRCMKLFHFSKAERFYINRK